MSIDYRDILADKDAGMTWAQLAEKYNFQSGNAIRKWTSRRRKADEERGGEEVGPPGEDIYELVKFVDKKKREAANWRSLIDVANRVADEFERDSISQRTAKVKINTSTPIILLFTGDWHLGDASTDHTAFLNMVAQVLDNDGVYMVDLGDDRQNARTSRIASMNLSQALPPQLQATLIRSLVDELTEKNKLIAKVGGNHDEEWDGRVFGEALQRYLLERMSAPFFGNRGLLFLEVGDIEYSLLLFHKSRFRSFLRTTHGNYREMTLSYPADIIAGGHDHKPGIEHVWHYTLAKEAGKAFGGESLLIKVGTFQDSQFGWRYFSNGGKIMPAVVLFPSEKRMIAFSHLDDAIRFRSVFA